MSSLQKSNGIRRMLHDKGENVKKNYLRYLPKSIHHKIPSFRFRKNLISPKKNFRAVHAVRNSNLSDMCKCIFIIHTINVMEKH